VTWREPGAVPVLPAPARTFETSLNRDTVTAAMLCSASCSPELRGEMLCDYRLRAGVMLAVARRSRTPWCETWHAQALIAGHPRLTRRAAILLARNLLDGINAADDLEVALYLAENDRLPRRWRDRVDAAMDQMV
jgi:hypothetical protein